MRNLLFTACMGAVWATTGLAAGSHEGGHGHDDGHTHMNAMDVGQPGEASEVTRTVQVRMYETDDGQMLFEPGAITFDEDETVRIEIRNDGVLEHEFVLDTVANNLEHREMMEKFPEMEHDDPNSVRLDPRETADIVWKFTNAGEFQFACLIPGHMEAGMSGPVKVGGS